MNKWQLMVLAIIIIALICVLCLTPEYVTRKEYRSTYHINWERIVFYSIPILLIGGFLVLMLNKKKQSENKELVNPGDATHTHEQK